MTTQARPLSPERVQAAQLAADLKSARETLVTQLQGAAKDAARPQAIARAQLRYYIRCTALLLKARGLKWSEFVAELPAEMRAIFFS